MPEGQKPTIPEIFLIIFDIIITGIVLLFIIFLVLSFGRELKTNDIARATVELADNLANSRLTESRLVFKTEELDKLDGSDTEPIRHCLYAYKAKVTSFEKIDGKNSWEFGYEPNLRGLVKESIGREFPVLIKKGASLFPGKLSLDVYDSWIATFTCLAETAYSSRKAQSITAPCFDLNDGRGYSIGYSKKTPGRYCMYDITGQGGGETGECRHFTVPVRDFKYVCKAGNEATGLNKVKAIPIRDGVSLPVSQSCKDIDTELLLPNEGQNVVTVALCFGEENK